MKQLQRLYQQRLPVDCITTEDFAQRLAATSTEINQPVSVYINRRGQVMRVGVGTLQQTQIPLLELPRYGAERLCGIRCLMTQAKDQEAPPNDATLTAMAIQRLDALVVLTLTGEGFQRRGGGATGYVKDSYLAHLVPTTTAVDSLWSLSAAMDLEELALQDFVALTEGLEAEFRRLYIAQSVDPDQDRALIVGLIDPKAGVLRGQQLLAELQRLVEAAGGLVVDMMTQARSRPHPQTVVGSGKVQDIALLAQTKGANLVVFDRDLSPAQIRNLENQMGLRVVDRTEVILDIFAQRAQSGAGKLQVELAQLEYMMPRLAGRGRTMSRLGGGIGTRGPGETKLETERRAIQRRITRLQQEVDQLQAHRSRLRQQRQHQETPAIALVGYTNAGKSTLLNVLTNSDIYAADQLFATLDPTTRRLAIVDDVHDRTVYLVLTDTVGFIHELPPSLVDAFRATLEEVTEADALIHVVDLSHVGWQDQIRDVMRILTAMPVTPGPILLVFNKVDQADSQELEIAKEEYPQAVFISARDRLGLDTLRDRLLNLIAYATT